MNIYLEWPIKDKEDIAIINKAKECIQNGIESFEYDELVFFIHQFNGDYYLDSISKDDLETVTSDIEWDESDFEDNDSYYNSDDDW